MGSQEIREVDCEFKFKLASQAFGLGSWQWIASKDILTYESGFSNEVYKGTLETWLETIFPEDVAPIKTALQEGRHRALGTVLTLDYRTKLAHSEVRFINIAVKIIDKDYFVGISRDVTKELKALMQQTAQLDVCHNELEALSYAISHDLRAPLRGIDGWSGALLEDYAHVLDETAKGYLMRVRDETKHMSTLITDLLKISQIAKTQMKIEGLNLSKIADAVSKQFLADSIGRRIKVSIQPDLLVQGDEEFMKIVITNLFSNSFKFTSKLEDAVIDFGKMVVDGCEVYYIKDNGAGFNSATAKKLFGTFQRMHRQQEFPGNGVGLSIVKRIINLHRGRIWAESYVNNGATFFFTLNE